MPADTKQDRLNAAAEAVGTALGRFATELAAWTHRGPRQPEVAKAIAAALAASSHQPASTPSNGRIGALAEIAHVPSRLPRSKARKSGTRRNAAAKGKAAKARARNARTTRGTR
jgi:hypothetical protein